MDSGAPVRLMPLGALLPKCSKDETLLQPPKLLLLLAALLIANTGTVRKCNEMLSCSASDGINEQPHP